MKWCSYSYSIRTGQRVRVPPAAEYEYEYENAVIPSVWHLKVVAFSEKCREFCQFERPSVLAARWNSRRTSDASEFAKLDRCVIRT